MGGMKDLFGNTPYPEPKALARATDLPTSHEAAKRVQPKVTKLQEAVLNDIKSSGAHGATWNEVAEHTSIDKGSISPRFKPLRNAGLIEAKNDADGKIIKRDHQTVWIAK